MLTADVKVNGKLIATISARNMATKDKRGARYTVSVTEAGKSGSTFTVTHDRSFGWQGLLNKITAEIIPTILETVSDDEAMRAAAFFIEESLAKSKMTTLSDGSSVSMIDEPGRLGNPRLDDDIAEAIFGKVIDDGFGNAWSKRCAQCGRLSMQIVRPGKAQCSHCG
jgi:hypothetical protein